MKTNHPRPARWTLIQDTKRVLAKMDIKALVQENPTRTVAIAAAVGAVLGLTVGSKAMRVLVSSVGMYTLGELLRRYAKQALGDLSADDKRETVTTHQPS